MEVVYYYDVDEKCCPVKNYLTKYIIIEGDSVKNRKNKNGILSNIDAKIRHIAQNLGNPTPPISSKMSGYDYFEIRQRKNKDVLIRIFYFRHNNKIILLNVLEKPNNYNDREEKRKINKQLDITEEYKNKFVSSPKLYEKY